MSVQVDGAKLPLAASYDAALFCELVHAEGAEVLATYGSEFYAGTPAITANHYGKGKAYTLCFQGGADFLGDFYQHIVREAGIQNPLGIDLPKGVSVKARVDGNTTYAFLMNFNMESVDIDLGRPLLDLLTGETLPAAFTMPPYGVYVLTY